MWPRVPAVHAAAVRLISPPCVLASFVECIPHVQQCAVLRHMIVLLPGALAQPSLVASLAVPRPSIPVVRDFAFGGSGVCDGYVHGRK